MVGAESESMYREPSGTETATHVGGGGAGNTAVAAASLQGSSNLKRVLHAGKFLHVNV